MYRILLLASSSTDTFCRAAKENFSMNGSGVCWMESSRSLLRPRNANGRIVEMLLPSMVSLRSTRRPANASPFIIGKLFFVKESSSTVCGSCCVGMSFSPPVLHRTCFGERQMHSVGQSGLFTVVVSCCNVGLGLSVAVHSR